MIIIIIVTIAQDSSDLKWEDCCWRVKADGELLPKCDRIWLATGTQFDATRDPLLADTLRIYPTEAIGGLPVLDPHLRIPGSECFVMGGLAALTVGPAARNLSGGRMACSRIVRAIVKPSLAVAVKG